MPLTWWSAWKSASVEQRADVAAAQPVHDPLSVPFALDQAGEAQL